MASLVLGIATIGQFFCSVACMTSCTRMLYAFSRDGAVPGASHWAKLSKNRAPVNGVLLTATIALIITSPALITVDVFGIPSPVAFTAVVSIGVVGLYLAFAIPIFLRWRAGDSFQQGSWNLGNKWRWMAPLAIAEILITSFIALWPTNPFGIPGHVGFAPKFVNYTPIVVGGALLALWIGWHLSAKHWFTGPKRTVDLPEGVSSADEIALEHHNEGILPGEHHRHEDPPAS
jgi:amino acid transporter